MAAKQLPRGIRINNPGNIDRTTDRWIGMSADQSGDPRFVVFDTPEDGLRALMRTLMTYNDKHGLNTIRGVINRWAPAKGKNPVTGAEYTQNTAGYVGHVSRLTGLDPDEPFNIYDRDIAISLTRAIVRHEQGSPATHDRPEFWFDDATYLRAAHRAGYAVAEHKPVSQSRTAVGTATAATGSAVALLWENAAEVLQGTVTALGPVGSFFTGDTMRAFVIGLAIAGFLAVAYAQWDERRRGVK